MHRRGLLKSCGRKADVNILEGNDGTKKVERIPGKKTAGSHPCRIAYFVHRRSIYSALIEGCVPSYGLVYQGKEKMRSSS